MPAFQNKNRGLEWSLPLIIMVAGTVLFYFSDLDLTISKLFFDPVEQEWLGNSIPVIRWSYTYGPYIAGALALMALFHFLASYIHPPFLVKRGISLFILLCILLGPVIIVNGFKETWRRPRPRNTLELGGHHPYQKVLVIKDRSYRGLSFPSGHASSGYVLFLLYFLLKRKKRGLAGAALGFGLIWGTWLGIVRIMLGGHFASDVLWAFGLVWYTTYALFYYWFPRYQRKLDAHQGFRLSKKRVAVGFSLLIIGIAGLSFRYLLSTPFRVEYPLEKLTLPPSVQRLEVHMRAEEGDIAVYYGKPGQVILRTWINGQGRSGIQADRQLVVEKEKTVWRIDYRVEPSGFFFEYQSHNSIRIPPDLKVKLDLFTNQGTVYRNDLNPKAGGK